MAAPAPRAIAAGTPVAGILFMMTATLGFSSLDTTGKYLIAQDLPPTQTAFLRFLAHTILLIAILRIWRIRGAFRPHSFPLQILRGLFLVGSTAFNFAALEYLQLAEAISIMFAMPLLVTALSGPLLGEQVGMRRWIAVGVGFLGVLIVTRPGFGNMHWAALLSLTAMVNYSFYAILTRRLGGSESSESLLLWSGIVGSIVLLPAAAPVFVMPDISLLPLIALMGVFGLSGHYLLVRAHKIASASLLAPYVYTQMLWVALLGFLVFGEVPDAWTIAGTTVIVGSGIYILHRERIRGRQPIADDPPVQ